MNDNSNSKFPTEAASQDRILTGYQSSENLLFCFKNSIILLFKNYKVYVIEFYIIMIHLIDFLYNIYIINLL